MVAAIDARTQQSLLAPRPEPWGKFLLVSLGIHVATLGAGLLIGSLTARPAMDLDAKRSAPTPLCRARLH